MAELKNSFTGGRMDKDTDERILQNGLYREALNVSVSTSEDSDVGAAQNIIGNIKVTEAVQSRYYTGDGILDNTYNGTNYHVASIVDPQTDMLYRFVHTAAEVEGLWMDRIVEFDTSKKINDSWEEKEAAVFVDIFKVRTIVNDCDLICASGNITTITVNRNLRQIRWGMRIEVEGQPDFFKDNDPLSSTFGETIKVTVEKVDYATGEIILDQGLSDLCALDPGTFITFHSDRNLNFGWFDMNGDFLRKITGINIVDGMIFWTDNFSEPKKINIERGKSGSDVALWNDNIYKITYAGNWMQEHQPFLDNFNHHTVLIVDNSIREEWFLNENTCNTIGCTDPLALNYNPLANIPCTTGCWGGQTGPDCCCEPCQYGCMDPLACNYDAAATCDDGSCILNCMYGCMDSTATNHDPGANLDCTAWVAAGSDPAGPWGPLGDTCPCLFCSNVVANPPGHINHATSNNTATGNSDANWMANGTIPGDWWFLLVYTDPSLTQHISPVPIQAPSVGYNNDDIQGFGNQDAGIYTDFFIVSHPTQATVAAWITGSKDACESNKIDFTIQIEGCIDPSAFSGYDQYATIQDFPSSCVYHTYGCHLPGACNHDPATSSPCTTTGSGGIIVMNGCCQYCGDNLATNDPNLLAIVGVPPADCEMLGNDSCADWPAGTPSAGSSGPQSIVGNFDGGSCNTGCEYCTTLEGPTGSMTFTSTAIADPATSVDTNTLNIEWTVPTINHINGGPAALVTQYMLTVWQYTGLSGGCPVTFSHPGMIGALHEWDNLTQSITGNVIEEYIINSGTTLLPGPFTPGSTQTITLYGQSGVGLSQHGIQNDDCYEVTLKAICNSAGPIVGEVRTGIAVIDPPISAPLIPGCMDGGGTEYGGINWGSPADGWIAYNYDAAATTDNGTCFYACQAETNLGSITQFVGSSYHLQAEVPDPTIQIEFNPGGFGHNWPITWPTNSPPENGYNTSWTNNVLVSNLLRHRHIYNQEHGNMFQTSASVVPLPSPVEGDISLTFSLLQDRYTMIQMATKCPAGPMASASCPDLTPLPISASPSVYTGYKMTQNILLHAPQFAGNMVSATHPVTGEVITALSTDFGQSPGIYNNEQFFLNRDLETSATTGLTNPYTGLLGDTADDYALQFAIEEAEASLDGILPMSKYIFWMHSFPIWDTQCGHQKFDAVNNDCIDYDPTELGAAWCGASKNQQHQEIHMHNDISVGVVCSSLPGGGCSGNHFIRVAVPNGWFCRYRMVTGTNNSLPINTVVYNVPYGTDVDDDPLSASYSGSATMGATLNSQVGVGNSAATGSVAGVAPGTGQLQLNLGEDYVLEVWTAPSMAAGHVATASGGAIAISPGNYKYVAFTTQL